MKSSIETNYPDYELHCFLIPVYNTAIAIAKNPIAHMQTKHIDIQYHFIQETIQDQLIELCYCPSEEIIADLLTKPLSKGEFEKLRELMGIKNC